MMNTAVQVVYAPCLSALVSLFKSKRYQTIIDELQGDKEQRHFHDAAEGFLQNNFRKPETKKSANDGNARQITAICRFQSHDAHLAARK